jgi:hypothetical protein
VSGRFDREGSARRRADELIGARRLDRAWELELPADRLLSVHAVANVIFHRDSFRNVMLDSAAWARVSAPRRGRDTPQSQCGLLDP